jgi:hypothetical protein
MSTPAGPETVQQVTVPKPPKSDSSDDYGFKDTPEGFENINIGGEPTLAKEDMLYRTARYKPPGRVENIYQTGRVLVEKVDQIMRPTSMQKTNQGFQAASNVVQAVTTGANAHGVIRGVAGGNVIAMGQAIVMTANALRGGDNLQQRYQQATDKVGRLIPRREVRENSRMNELLGKPFEALTLRRRESENEEDEEPIDDEEEWELWDFEQHV